MEKLYYSYDLFVKDTQLLVDKCRDFEPEILLAVARGGLTLAHLMSQAMDMRNLYTLNSIHYEGDLKLDTFNIFNIIFAFLSKKYYNGIGDRYDSKRKKNVRGCKS